VRCSKKRRNISAPRWLRPAPWTSAPIAARGASGIVNSSYQVGAALGLATMTALATAHGADQIGDVASLTDGYSAAFLGAAGLAAAGAALAAALLRTPKADATAVDQAPRRATRSPPDATQIRW
jgi:hypothetical protein